MQTILSDLTSDILLSTKYTVDIVIRIGIIRNGEHGEYLEMSQGGHDGQKHEYVRRNEGKQRNSVYATEENCRSKMRQTLYM